MKGFKPKGTQIWRDSNPKEYKYEGIKIWKYEKIQIWRDSTPKGFKPKEIQNWEDLNMKGFKYEDILVWRDSNPKDSNIMEPKSEGIQKQS